MNRSLHLASAHLILVAGALTAHAQAGALLSEVQKSLESRRAEIDRMQKTAKDTAATKSTLPMMPSRLRVEAGTVTDARSSVGAGPLTIQLNIFTDEIPANAFIRRHEIISATDDQGRPILPSTNPGAATMLQPRGDGPRIVRTLTFQAPPRRADAIKLIEGTLEVFVPAEETGSLVRIPGYGEHLGKPLDHPVLAKNGIELSSLTKEMYDTLKPQWEKSTASVSTAPTSGPSALFLLKDKDSRFVGIELRDPDGKTIPTNFQALSTNALGTSLLVVRFQGQVRPDAEVRLLIADPAALRLFPFRLENIPLP